MKAGSIRTLSGIGAPSVCRMIRGIVYQYTKVQTASDALKESADALLDKSLFKKKDITTTDEDGNKTTVKDYDTDSIYKAVNSFVKDYNSVINAMDGTKDDTLERRVDYMNSQSSRNKKNLEAVGISINKDGTLAIPWYMPLSPQTSFLPLLCLKRFSLRQTLRNQSRLKYKAYVL